MVFVDYQWFFVVLSVASRRFSMVVVESQWVFEVLVTFQWFSVVHTGSRSSQCSRRFSMVLSGSRRFSMFLSASCLFS